ncbi:hypothetical protein B9S53_19025, partial [Arthrospira sp. O9.13F]
EVIDGEKCASEPTLSEDAFSIVAFCQSEFTATFLAKLGTFGVDVEAVWVETLAHNQEGY